MILPTPIPAIVLQTVDCQSSGDAEMASKLDPELLASLENAETSRSDDARSVDVMLGLARPIDGAMRADLTALGLTVRSEIGDILTGSVAMRDVRKLAASPAVVKIEASRPMQPEGAGELPTG